MMEFPISPELRQELSGDEAKLWHQKAITVWDTFSNLNEETVRYGWSEILVSQLLLNESSAAVKEPAPKLAPPLE